MRELFGENEQLVVWNFQGLRWRRRRDRLRFLIAFGTCSDDLDPNRDATFLLDLANGNGAIGAIQHAFHQCALRVAGSISKLWHRTGS